MLALLRNEVHYQNEIENSFRIISTAKEGPQVSHLDHDLTINDIPLRYTYFLGARPSILLWFHSSFNNSYARIRAIILKPGKKWCYIHDGPKWRSNQEWCSIGRDTVSMQNHQHTYFISIGLTN